MKIYKDKMEYDNIHNNRVIFYTTHLENVGGYYALHIYKKIKIRLRKDNNPLMQTYTQCDPLERNWVLK